MDEGSSHRVRALKKINLFIYHEKSKVLPKTKTLKIGKRGRLFRDLEAKNKNQVLDLNSQG